MNKKFKAFRPLALVPIALTACFLIASCSLIPRYERPAAPVPAQWPATADAAAAADTRKPDWRTYLTDPKLRQLIATALANNRDLRVALLAIEQARAQLGIRRADQFPTVNAAINGSRTPSSSGGINSSYNAGLLVTAYEIDFFGRVAALKEQALAQYLASAEASQTVQISLIAAVAHTWLSLLADDELLVITQQTVNSRDESLKLVELKLKHGAASDFDLRAAQTLLESASVTLAQQTRQRTLDENALALLLGQPLNDAQATPLAEHKLAQVGFAELPAGLPSDLLTRRPDIRQAEHNLIASNANIGAARAAFFPRISLTTGTGSASSELTGLFKDGSWGWTLAPQLVLPIFDAGRNQANLEASQIGRDIAVAQYEKSIQTAFREVADALASRSALNQQFQAQQALVQAEAARSQLAKLRLDNGVANQLEWLDAQRSLFAAQQAMVQTRLAYLQNQVTLFRVLGGGARLTSDASGQNISSTP